MNSLSTLLLGALLALGVSTQSIAQNIDFGRGEVLVKVPESYRASDAHPLIILLHGYTSSGQSQDNYFQVSDLADDYGFLFVAPDGVREPSGQENRFWNASDACCNFFGVEVDDSAYIRSIIDEMKSRLPDRSFQRRLYVLPYGLRPLRLHCRHRQPGRCQSHGATRCTTEPGAYPADTRYQ